MIKTDVWGIEKKAGSAMTFVKAVRCMNKGKLSVIGQKTTTNSVGKTQVPLEDRTDMIRNFTSQPIQINIQIFSLKHSKEKSIVCWRFLYV